MISDMHTPQNVQSQYADSRNLTIRQRLHNKHSVNQYGLHNWIFDQYQFEAHSKILELGCGTGAFWESRIDRLPEDALLLLSDFSDGMVREAWKRLAFSSKVLVQRMDIQDIPFADGSFDHVIANHMLYHVPDLGKAISEVCRVLKPAGVFYCTTNGTEGMSKYLHTALKDYDASIDAFGESYSPFTLQNGEAALKQYFTDIQTVRYADALRVTETRDLVDWIESTVSMASLPAEKLSGLFDYFEGIRAREGAIEIPKEAGMFVARK